MNKYKIRIAVVVLFFISGSLSAQKQAERWTEEKINAWYAKLPWLVGANYTPAYAINQLEFWQNDTFDPAVIDKELGWAQGLGMNTLRVYLHDLAWKQDAKGFKKNINTFLSIAEKHKIKPLFVFFDDCWNAEGKIGVQPAPKPGVHNSGWLRSPLKSTHDDPAQWGYLKAYVQDILKTFGNDKRILLWDLYNEPGNSSYGNKSMPLLKSVFGWAREINPSQPVTAGIWHDNLKELDAFQLANSDVITYHHYDPAPSHQKRIDSLKAKGRPLICTEYMARRNNSTFQTILPILYKERIGAINWGLVDGKTNTKYAWDEPIKDGSEPPLWFHEIFRKDGTAYDPKETELIKSLTSQANK
ncbi:cellulase family glycosylhydrolase [Pedobacter metabolipauper]|uniref:Cellulase (Glycosyl hydrolase family 5) n=1 Tax=Pedobacter metabolipauper TaxID=425513 RepID=A0A4R6SWW6_9SPHI|nr:cellulase family glycosylhydrolase [Pedobacter metabolipauper]TDQ10350.1 cellulase (glycosyl hydrolase family 5) [Pedobacter metabolipauper]